MRATALPDLLQMTQKLPLRAALFACALLLTAAAFAQDATGLTLRERIKDRLEQRRAAAGQPDAPPAESSPAAPLAAGTHTLYLNHGGHRRKYLVHLPHGLDPAKPAALVVALHGGGGHAEHMADDAHYGLTGKADREGFVVVFPNGYSKFPGGRFATWNAGGCCGDARDQAIDDVGFVRAVVAAVKAQVHVDGARVFATGMSNGGMLSHRLACDAADVFRAVASVAGTDATASCTPARPVSVLHIHARDDDHVLFGGGAGPGAFRDASKVMAFTSVPETVSRWVRRDQCSTTPSRVPDRAGADHGADGRAGIGAYCEAYTGCAGGASVQLCVTDTGGHSWPGAQAVRRGKAGASTALNANDVIWDFFRASPAR
jgi:polyhydroxybutyrate depolymerase